MNQNLRDIVLHAYYGATLPRRRKSALQRAQAGSEPVRILFYHRVADTYPNDWTISTHRFAKQIRWLCRHFDIVDLAEAQSRIASGKNSRPTVCITFDDGYADNCAFAIPLLHGLRVPFTYFVATNHVFYGEPFPHDLKAGQPIAPNTRSQLGEIAAAGGEIAAHTRSHADLGAVSSSEQLTAEIVGSKHDLETALGREVRYFAFPYGMPANMSRVAFQVAYQAGFAGVCSAYGGYNYPGDDAFHLRRFHGDPQFVRLKNWCTLDPRKVRTQRDFEPGTFREQYALSNRPLKDQFTAQPLIAGAADQLPLSAANAEY